MRPLDADVLVVGGGPAGAATALALRRHRPGLSVAVVERDGYDRQTVGETLPPQATPLLRRLGLWEAFQRQNVTSSAGTAAAWGNATPHANDFVFGGAGPGWHLDRAAFDRWLADEAKAAGASLTVGARVAEAAWDGDGWTLALDQNGGTRTASARFVVDATGRAAAFARRHGVRRGRCDALVGLVRFFQDAACTTHTLVEAVPEGWWYTAALPGGRAVAALMTDADLAQTLDLRRPEVWAARLTAAPHTRERLERAEADGPVRTCPAQTQALAPCTGPGWLAVGDAASAFDPLSSLGLLKALRSGLLAAYAVGDALDGEARALPQYAALVAGEFEAYRDTHREMYGRERRWPAAPFWARRQTTTALVDQSLARLSPGMAASRKRQIR